MAKLNVTVPAVQVEVNGAVYTKVDRRAADGDIVRVLRGGDDITDGGFYAVYADYSGDLVFDDDGGDERYEWLQDCPEYFEVYEKVAAKSSSVFSVGDAVKLLSTGGGLLYGFEVGDICRVSHEIDGDGDTRITRNGHSGYAQLHQLEKVAEPALRLTVGDYAEVVRKTEEHDYVIGSVIKIVHDDEDSCPYKGEKADGSTGIFICEEDVEPATEAEFLAQQKPEPPSEDDVITHEGRRYRKVAREANVGDLVLCVIAGIGVNSGQVFVSERTFPAGNAAGFRNGDNVVEFVPGTRQRKYYVLEPIKPESPYVIHDGAVYVKQARKAEVGELIVVTAWESRCHISDHSNVGDIKTAASVDNDGDVHPGGIPVIYLSEYNVLVPVETESLAQQRKATVGDRIRIVATDDERWQNGEEFVVDAEKDTGVLVKHPKGTSSGRAYVSSGEYVVLRPSVTEVKRKAAVGDRIRIVKEYASGGFYKNGDELTVNRVSGSGTRHGGVWCNTPAGEAYVSYIHGEYVVLEQDAPAASAVPPVSPRLNVGDYAKVIDDRGSSKCSVGDIVKITERGGRDGETLTFETGGGVIGWMYARRFVLATEGERKQAEEIANQSAVTAKWNAIGRKVAEFKAGDVVENGGRLYTVTGVGEPGYICAEDGVTLTGGQWRFKYNVNLIAPVESLFNGR